MIVRHDIDPRRYLADVENFLAVVPVDSFEEEVQVAYDKIDELLKPSLLPIEKTFRTRYDGMGTLIHPRWVLTAAHVVTELSDDKTIEIGDGDYAVERIVLHPNFRNFNETEMAENDIALIQLSQSVETVVPLPLYTQKDEVGQIVTFVGRGDYGTGLVGPDQGDGKLRTATNRVEDADDQWLIFNFDAPPNGTDLEGVSGPGDSGGPALIRTGEGWAIGGISSGEDDESIRNFGEGRYGVREYYTRVSFQLDWINSVVG